MTINFLEMPSEMTLHEIATRITVLAAANPTPVKYTPEWLLHDLLSTHTAEELAERGIECNDTCSDITLNVYETLKGDTFATWSSHGGHDVDLGTLLHGVENKDGRKEPAWWTGEYTEVEDEDGDWVFRIERERRAEEMRRLETEAAED